MQGGPYVDKHPLLDDVIQSNPEVVEYISKNIGCRDSK